MSSLFGSLSIAREALLAQQMGLSVTQNNISNVNTAGYTRQRLNLVPGAPVAMAEYQWGMGVSVQSVDAYRDRLVSYRLNQELQRQAAYSSTSSVLEQVESVVNDLGGSGLQSGITDFFNSFASLANTPEDVSLRQQVLSQGELLASRFRTTYEQIQSIQTLQDRGIADAVQEINSLSAEIARLNVEVVAAKGVHGNESTLRDQRQQLLDGLGRLVDISYFETESGSVTVMTPQGALLAVGTAAYAWNATVDAEGHTRIVSEGADITSKIQSGKLGGLIQARDTYIPGYLASLDDLAAAIMSRVNEQHAEGADLDGLRGGNFFAPFTSSLPGTNVGAARNMSVAITDTDKIAAGEMGAGPGSNTNAQKLAAIPEEALLSGNSVSINQHYASFIFRIGMDAGTVSEQLQTQDHLVVQLQNQRDALSGVSLDEEAIDLMRYQKAYEANARFINLVDSLTEEIIQLLGD